MPISDDTQSPPSNKYNIDYFGNILKSLGWGCVVLAGCYVGYGVAIVAFNAAIMTTLLGGGFLGITVGDKIEDAVRHPEAQGWVGEKLVKLASTQLGYLGATLKLAGRVALMAGGFGLGIIALSPAALLTVVASICLTVIPLNLLGIWRGSEDSQPYKIINEASKRGFIASVRAIARAIVNIQIERNVYTAASCVLAGFGAFVLGTAILSMAALPALAVTGSLLGASMLYYSKQTEDSVEIMIAERTAALQAKLADPKQNPYAESNHPQAITRPAATLPTQANTIAAHINPFDEFDNTSPPSPPSSHTSRLFSPPAPVGKTSLEDESTKQSAPPPSP
jgi:hypothetical protein